MRAHPSDSEILPSVPILSNVTISDNVATNYGGGIYSWGSNPIIKNVTISRNIANNFSSGMYITNSELTITNSIIWNNGSDAIYFNYGWADGPPNITYSDIENYSDIEGWEGEGNIDQDPLFNFDFIL